MSHDPITTNRIHFLCQTILNKPSYKVLSAPLYYSRNRVIDSWDLNVVHVEFKNFETELFSLGFIPTKAIFYLQPDGKVALSGYEHFSFKMLRPDGTTYALAPGSNS